MKMKWKTKTTAQLFTLACGAAMLGLGIWRHEVNTVLTKAGKICLECVGIG